MSKEDQTQGNLTLREELELLRTKALQLCEDCKALRAETDQKSLIITELKKLYYYAEMSNWRVTKNDGSTQEIRKAPTEDCSKHEDAGWRLILGGKLAREVKKKVILMENGR